MLSLLLVIVIVLSPAPLGFFALSRRFRSNPIQRLSVLLGLSWVLLVVAGVLQSGAFVELLSVPLAVASVLCLAGITRFLPERPRTIRWLYWVSACLTVFAALHTGTEVWGRSAIGRQYSPAPYLAKADGPWQFALWCLPSGTVAMCILRKKDLTVAQRFIIGIGLLMLNPLIWIAGRHLKLPISM